MMKHSTPEANAHFLAIGLDDFLIERGDAELDQQEFDYVVDAFCSFSSDQKRYDFAQLLTRHSRDEITYRTKALTRLTNLLKHIQKVPSRVD